MRGRCAWRWPKLADGGVLYDQRWRQAVEAVPQHLFQVLHARAAETDGAGQ